MADDGCDDRSLQRDDCDGGYQFKKDGTITTTNQHGSNMNQATTIDATGKTLTFILTILLFMPSVPIPLTA